MGLTLLPVQHTATANMASGVAVDNEVKLVFEKIRTRHTGDAVEEQLKIVLFRISDDEKSIIVDENGSLKVKDLEGETDIFKKVVAQLPQKQCRYALYDCSFETKEGVTKEDLVFIMWAPDSATIKSKMQYASSKGAIRTLFKGIKCEWQINDEADARDSSVFLEKLGGKGTVKKLEGKDI